MARCNNIIFFNSEKARKHLLEKGYVYTLRFPRRTGKGKAIKGNNSNREFLCFVYITFIKKIKDPKELEPYVNESGFNSVDEWVNEVKRFHGGFYAQYLYKVKIIPPGRYYRGRRNKIQYVD